MNLEAWRCSWCSRYPFNIWRLCSYAAPLSHGTGNVSFSLLISLNTDLSSLSKNQLCAFINISFCFPFHLPISELGEFSWAYLYFWSFIICIYYFNASIVILLLTQPMFFISTALSRFLRYPSMIISSSYIDATPSFILSR